MSFVSGTAGSVAVVSGGTTVVTGTHSWSLSADQDTPEVTAFGDSWGVFLPGIRRWTGSFELYSDNAVTIQNTVQGYLTGGSTPVEFRFFKGANYYTGSALVTNDSPEISYDDKGVTKFDIQGSGPLVYV